MPTRAGTSTTPTRRTRRGSTASSRAPTPTRERNDLFGRLADRRGSPHRAVGRALPRGGPAAAGARRGPPHAAARVGRADLRSRVGAAADPRRGRARGAGLSRPGAPVHATADLHQAAVDIAVGLGRARARAVRGHGTRRGAVARRRRRRAAAQHRLRIQRWADGELRPRRRRRRRQPRRARRHRHRRRRRDRRRVVDGIERLPGREERSGGAGAPDRDGAPGDAR